MQHMRMQHIEKLLTDIRLEMAGIRTNLRAAVQGRAVGDDRHDHRHIAVALIAMFVSVLSYLQAFHVLY
jgi:hypothetical protein